MSFITNLAYETGQKILMNDTHDIDTLMNILVPVIKKAMKAGTVLEIPDGDSPAGENEFGHHFTPLT